MDPKRAKLDLKSWFGHVRTSSWLHKLRTHTRGNTWNISIDSRKYIYGTCKEYIRNIHKYLWCEIIRNTGTAFGGRPIGSVFLIILYHKYLWIFLSYSLYIPYIYIYFLAMFHIFSLVCFLIYGVKSRSGHDRSKIVSSST